MGSIVLRCGQLAVSVVVARLVAPEQFGIYAAALVVYAIVTNISDLGLTSALIVEPARTKELAPTVMTSVLISSTGMSLLLAGLAGPLAALLGAPAARPVIQVMAASIVVGAVGAVPGAVLVRDFRQRAKFVVDSSSFVFGALVLIVLAASGAGAMALAWSRVATQAASLISLLALARERYWPGFSRAAYGHVLRIGLPVAGSSLVGFAVGNVDNFAVARTRGAHELGLYSQAYNISGWPVAVFTAMVDSISVPALSRVRDNSELFLRHLRAAVSLLGFVGCLASALISALAGPLVSVLFGAKWAGAADALQLLAWFGGIRVLIALCSDALVALKRTRWLLWLNCLWVTILIPAMMLASQAYGMRGAALMHTVVAAFVMFPLFVLLVGRAASIGFVWVLGCLGFPALGAVLAYFAAVSVSTLPAPAWLRLLAGAAAGTVVYLAVVAFWANRVLLPELRELYAHGKTPVEIRSAVSEDLSVPTPIQETADEARKRQ
ncbi:hypothetical protein LK10_17645 [Sinomonas humi]|uniref:Polysaccharide biosynthesis protein n=2 Tax=Sinomonas humi TaxID=1338436 RepID=A0A0B2ADB1_9MICC|nr:hypothetical protein LK10_17645 [Sinomonas humi]